MLLSLPSFLFWVAWCLAGQAGCKPACGYIHTCPVLSDSQEWLEETLLHSHWGETAQVHTMQLFSQSCCHSEKAHYETHWRETASVQSMQLYYNSIKQSEEAQRDPLWGKAAQMHNVRVFQHYNQPIARSHDEEPYRRKAKQV